MGTAWTYSTDPNDEHDAVRERAGMFDMSPLKKVFVRGTDAMAVLNHLTTRDLSRVSPGHAAYLSVLTENGTMADDAIVSNNGGDEWMIVHGSGDTMALLEASANGHSVDLEFTDALHDISVQGPGALDILNAHCDADLATMKYFHHAPAILFGHACRISRTGYFGERGYEVFADEAVVGEIWDGLAAEGKEKLHNVCLDIAHDDMVNGEEVLAHGGTEVGVVNSPCHSHRLGKSLALAHVAPSASAVGTSLTLSGGGIETTATVVAMPIYDPQKSRTHS